VLTKIDRNPAALDAEQDLEAHDSAVASSAVAAGTDATPAPSLRPQRTVSGVLADAANSGRTGYRQLLAAIALCVTDLTASVRSAMLDRSHVRTGQCGRPTSGGAWNRPGRRPPSSLPARAGMSRAWRTRRQRFLFI